MDYRQRYNRPNSLWSPMHFPSFKSITLLLLAFSIAQTSVLQPSHAQNVPQEETQRPTSTPYRGDLSIFDYADRDQKLHIDRVMDLLDIGQGKSIADIGAGSGWFTVRAAARVTPTGEVYAEDISPDAVSHIRDRAAKEQLDGLERWVRQKAKSGWTPPMPGQPEDASPASTGKRRKRAEVPDDFEANMLIKRYLDQHPSAPIRDV